MQGDTILPKGVSIGSNEQSRRTFPQSLTGPEFGTNAASSYHQVLPSSQQPALSYQVPLSSQQPLDDAIEARENTTKRQKISGHATSQARGRLCTIQGANQNISRASSEAYQALDVASAVNALQSLQHSNQGTMPQLEHRPQSSWAAIHGNVVPSSEEVRGMQDRDTTHFGLYTDESVVGQQLPASCSGPPQSMFDNADTQQPLSVDNDLPPSTNSNADPAFVSYVIDIAHTLDDGTRLAFGLDDSLG
jgi:hypothetical protein